MKMRKSSKKIFSYFKNASGVLTAGRIYVRPCNLLKVIQMEDEPLTARRGGSCPTPGMQAENFFVSPTQFFHIFIKFLSYLSARLSSK